MFTFVSSAWTSLRAYGQAWCFKAAWERVRDWMFECFMVKSSDESCMFCILHAFCVVFHLWFVPVCLSLCVITSILWVYIVFPLLPDTFLISKASFSALDRVQLPQDCQIRLSLVASPPLSFTPLVHINAWGVPLFDDKQNSDSFGSN